MTERVKFILRVRRHKEFSRGSLRLRVDLNSDQYIGRTPRLHYTRNACFGHLKRTVPPFTQSLGTGKTSKYLLGYQYY